MKHRISLMAPPSHTPNTAAPDGAVTGNGDLGMVLGGVPECLSLYFAKADFWQMTPAGGGIRGIGRLNIVSPDLTGGSWQVTLDLDTAELTGRFIAYGQVLELRGIVCAVENVILLEFSGTVEFDASLELFTGNGSLTSLERQPDWQLAIRRFDSPDVLFATEAAAILKTLPEKSSTGKFRRRLALFVGTAADGPTYLTQLTQKAKAFNEAAFQTAWEMHRVWWDRFYAKSRVAISDPELELNWYAGLYFMACCSRNLRFPPGIYGNFITTDQPGWGGDYHLNYNYEAAFYGVITANHPELTDGYAAPLEDFIPEGRRFAREFLGCRGIYYPVSLGPCGLNLAACAYSEEHGILFLGQKSNALQAADIMIFRWYATRDLAYAAEHLYPYLKEVVAFWMDYLRWENGCFNSCDDAAYEVEHYIPDFRAVVPEVWEHDRNNVLTLGLLGLLFEALTDLAETLQVDSDELARWRKIQTHLPPFPVFEKECGTVFRLTESGRAWNAGNAVMLQHIYPAGRIGLGSSSELLEIARRTFNADDRWLDGNAFCTYAPCAARIGIAPERILAGLRQNLHQRQFPNLLFNHPGGCLENCGVVTTTLNEMLMQSHEGIIRFFPVWPCELDASFENLRADGAFLVSGCWRNGGFISGRIFCEKGGICRIDPARLEQCHVLHGEVSAPLEPCYAMQPGETLQLTTQ